MNYKICVTGMNCRWVNANSLQLLDLTDGLDEESLYDLYARFRKNYPFGFKNIQFILANIDLGEINAK